jgi:probable phosphoglycerate mutase
VALTDKGRAQAACAARALKDVHIDAAYASDLVRAYETGEIIAREHGLKVVPDSNLREIYAGEWEEKLFTDLDVLFPEDYRAWVGDMANCRCTGGESIRELDVRIRTECEAIARREEGKTVLIATHATPIRVMQLAWQGMSIEDIAEITWVMNASISVADFEDGKWTPVVIGEASHLGKMQTALPKDI